MPETFDPYHRWLGIPRKDQPPTHYRLLGIEEFESDAEVIRDAAQRQMAHVRRYQLGPNVALSQEILNRLGAAKACLSDPARRAAYDEALRKRRTAEAAAAPSTPKPPVVPALVKPRAAGSDNSQPLSARAPPVPVPPPLPPAAPVVHSWPLTRSIYEIAEDAPEQPQEAEPPPTPTVEPDTPRAAPPPIPLEPLAQDVAQTPLSASAAVLASVEVAPAAASPPEARVEKPPQRSPAPVVAPAAAAPPRSFRETTLELPADIPSRIATDRAAAVDRAAQAGPAPWARTKNIMAAARGWQTVTRKANSRKLSAALLAAAAIVIVACVLIVRGLRHQRPSVEPGSTPPATAAAAEPAPTKTK